MFQLQFDRNTISDWAGHYQAQDDHHIEIDIAPAVQKRGYYTCQEFLDICRWKTPRSKPLVASNPEPFIAEVTRTALSTPSQRLRIEVLTLLAGVSWPTASVLLHFGHKDPYPILDFRTLWSLGVDAATVQYDFDFWWNYTQYCRTLANECGITMRTLDRALWQYSKKNKD